MQPLIFSIDHSFKNHNNPPEEGKTIKKNVTRFLILKENPKTKEWDEEIASNIYQEKFSLFDLLSFFLLKKSEKTSQERNRFLLSLNLPGLNFPFQEAKEPCLTGMHLFSFVPEEFIFYLCKELEIPFISSSLPKLPMYWNFLDEEADAMMQEFCQLKGIKKENSLWKIGNSFFQVQKNLDPDFTVEAIFLSFSWQGLHAHPKTSLEEIMEDFFKQTIRFLPGKNPNSDSLAKFIVYQSIFGFDCLDFQTRKSLKNQNWEEEKAFCYLEILNKQDPSSLFLLHLNAQMFLSTSFSHSVKENLHPFLSLLQKSLSRFTMSELSHFLSFLFLSIPTHFPLKMQSFENEIWLRIEILDIGFLHFPLLFKKLSFSSEKWEELTPFFSYVFSEMSEEFQEFPNLNEMHTFAKQVLNRPHPNAIQLGLQFLLYEKKEPSLYSSLEKKEFEPLLSHPDTAVRDAALSLLKALADTSEKKEKAVQIILKVNLLEEAFHYFFSNERVSIKNFISLTKSAYNKNISPLYAAKMLEKAKNLSFSEEGEQDVIFWVEKALSYQQEKEAFSFLQTFSEEKQKKYKLCYPTLFLSDEEKEIIQKFEKLKKDPLQAKEFLDFISKTREKIFSWMGEKDFQIWFEEIAKKDPPTFDTLFFSFCKPDFSKSKKVFWQFYELLSFSKKGSSDRFLKVFCSLFEKSENLMFSKEFWHFLIQKEIVTKAEATFQNLLQAKFWDEASISSSFQEAFQETKDFLTYLNVLEKCSFPIQDQKKCFSYLIENKKHGKILKLLEKNLLFFKNLPKEFFSTIKEKEKEKEKIFKELILLLAKNENLNLDPFLEFFLNEASLTQLRPLFHLLPEKYLRLMEKKKTIFSLEENLVLLDFLEIFWKGKENVWKNDPVFAKETLILLSKNLRFSDDLLFSWLASSPDVYKILLFQNFFPEASLKRKEKLLDGIFPEWRKLDETTLKMQWVFSITHTQDPFIFFKLINFLKELKFSDIFMLIIKASEKFLLLKDVSEKEKIQFFDHFFPYTAFFEENFSKKVMQFFLKKTNKEADAFVVHCLTNTLRLYEGFFRKENPGFEEYQLKSILFIFSEIFTCQETSETNKQVAILAFLETTKEVAKLYPEKIKTCLPFIKKICFLFPSEFLQNGKIQPILRELSGDERFVFQNSVDSAFLYLLLNPPLLNPYFKEMDENTCDQILHDWKLYVKKQSHQELALLIRTKKIFAERSKEKLLILAKSCLKHLSKEGLEAGFFPEITCLFQEILEDSAYQKEEKISFLKSIVEKFSSLMRNHPFFSFGKVGALTYPFLEKLMKEDFQKEDLDSFTIIFPEFLLEKLAWANLKEETVLKEINQILLDLYSFIQKKGSSFEEVLLIFFDTIFRVDQFSSHIDKTIFALLKTLLIKHVYPYLLKQMETMKQKNLWKISEKTNSKILALTDPSKWNGPIVLTIDNLKKKKDATFK